MKKIMLVFGTRPEAIKMCPLALQLKKRKDVSCKICLTGQHKEMLNQVMECFGVVPDYNLDIMQKEQTLSSITILILQNIERIIKKERPDIIFVHGDTTTAFATALAAFYQKIPVGHVESGLRTGNVYSPYPEEMNRLLIGRIAEYHFAPTELNKQNLKEEKIIDNVFVTGNTVIDAFKFTIKKNYIFHEKILNELNFRKKKVILVTAHRRENIGAPLENICEALRKIAKMNMDIEIVYPMHLNPKVRKIASFKLKDIENVHLMDPLDVIDMHNLMARCYMVMTDSGGLQEEAPAFGKPVLVLRRETERTEAVKAGTVKVVGTNVQNIYKESMLLLNEIDEYNKMSSAVNPYGDGHASEKIIDVLLDVSDY